MDEKNLKIIRYLTGAMVISRILTISPSIYTTIHTRAWESMNALPLILWILECILLIAGELLIAFSMFRKKYPLLMAGTGVMAFRDLLSLIPGMYFVMFIWFFADILLVVAMFKREKAVEFGIISAGLCIIAVILESLPSWHIIFYNGVASIPASNLLVCLVLQNTPQIQTTNKKQTVAAMKTDNRIEELTKLKDLLDTGAITQEEFAAKKKQILWM